MDFSEKDAARSKWKLTQRHRRGRGRGATPAGPGGRGSRGGTAAARDLGTNEDRYFDEEAAAATAAALGPVQQSQGADLAQLLAQAEPFDRGFYHRARVNLAQELGLPPEPAGGGFQGLTFDLKGLAACLELLPRNQVLDTDAFSDEDAGDDSGSQGEAEEELPDLDDEEWERQLEAVSAAQPLATAAAPLAGGAAARLPVPATPAASRPPHAGGQLQPSAVLQQQAAPALPGKAIQPQRAAVAATRPAQDEHDEELDMLLGLGTDQGAAPLPATVCCAMAGGFAPAAPGVQKIKGGRWTVFRFFLVSVAFTSAWVAVSSQLGYYRKLHGPAVLLQLNIAYFLPSIPLLIVSAFLDRPLEARLGVAKTILVRLVLGLLGYGAVTAWFPFMPERIWFLLGAVVALGLFSGIAFSAAYQLVARFANKNVIALGLGCAASGPLVLAMQLVLEMGPVPTRHQQILLYEAMAVLIVAGLWATASLLLRHWGAIEKAAGKQDLVEPLLTGQDDDGGVASPAAPDAGFSFALPASPRTPPSPQGQLATLGEALWKQRSLPPLVAYSSLEPFQSPFLSSECCSSEGSPRLRQLSAPPAVLPGAAVPGSGASADGAAGAAGAAVGEVEASPQPSVKESIDFAGAGTRPDSSASGPGHGADATLSEAGTARAAHSAPGSSATWQALPLIWAPLTALGLSSTVALTLFPFFTYVPTSGLLGESLPQVLFFARIFADVLGRFLPRLSLLAAESPLTPLAAAGAKLAGVPILLLYIKSPDRLHSDVFAVLLVAAVWLLGGYINTMANMMAPRLVPPQLKGAAAGAMAIAYQVAHFVGLAAATLLVYLMFGHIGVD
ncbi:hypothetical protein ABPG77_000354 [Micractinium sp. CCAP 211/92]